MRKLYILPTLFIIFILCTGFSIYWKTPLSVNGKEKIEIASGYLGDISFNCESHSTNHSAASIIGTFHLKGDFTIHSDSFHMVYHPWDGGEDIRIDTLCLFYNRQLKKNNFYLSQKFIGTKELKDEWEITCILNPNCTIFQNSLHPLAAGCLRIIPCNFIMHQGETIITDTIEIAYTDIRPLHTTANKRSLTKDEQKRFYSILLNTRHYGSAGGRKKAKLFLEEDSLHYFTITPIYLRKNFRTHKDSIMRYSIFEYKEGNKHPRHYDISNQADKNWLTQFLNEHFNNMLP